MLLARACLISLTIVGSHNIFSDEQSKLTWGALAKFMEQACSTCVSFGFFAEWHD